MIEECGARWRWPYIGESSIFKSCNFSYSRYVSGEFIQGSWCIWSYPKSPTWGISWLKNVEPVEDGHILMAFQFLHTFVDKWCHLFQIPPSPLSPFWRYSLPPFHLFWWRHLWTAPKSLLGNLACMKLFTTPHDSSRNETSRSSCMGYGWFCTDLLYKCYISVGQIWYSSISI